MSTRRAESRASTTGADVARLDLTGACLLAAAFTAPWTGTKMAGLPVADLLLVAASLAALAAAAIGRRSVKVRAWTLLPSAAAFAILAINVVLGAQSLLTDLSPNATGGTSGVFAGQGGGLLFVLRTLLATAVVFILVESELRRRGTVGGLRVLEAFVWGSAVSAAVAGYTELTGDVLLPAGDLIAEQRAWGLAFHPNSLGQSMALAIPAVFCVAALKPRGALRTIVAPGLLMLFGWGLVLADSRGALAVAGIVGATSLFVALYRATRGAWLLPTGIFLALAMGAFLPAFFEGTRLTQGGLLGLNDYDEGRWEQLEAAWELFSQHPLVGAGLGSGTGVMVPAYLLSSGGLVLFLSFYAFILIGLREVWRRESPIPRAYGLISIAALVLMGLPNNSVNERFDYISFAAVVATAIACGSPRPHRVRAQSEARARVRSVSSRRA